MSFFFFFAFIHFSFTEIDMVYKVTYCCLLIIIRLFFFLLLSIAHLQKLAIFIQQSYFFFFKHFARVSDSIRFVSISKFIILILRFLLFSLWYFQILLISYCIAWFFDAFQISNLVCNLLIWFYFLLWCLATNKLFYWLLLLLQIDMLLAINFLTCFCQRLFIVISYFWVLPSTLFVRFIYLLSYL